MAVQSPPQGPVRSIPFTMPAAEIGDPVLFFSDLTDPHGSLAFVMQANNRSIDLLNMSSHTVFTGIRHRNDPELKTHIDLIVDTGGCWSEAKTTKRLEKVEQALEQLSAEQGKILAALNKAAKA